MLEQIGQIAAFALRCGHCATVTRRQACGINVSSQRFLVLAVEDDLAKQTSTYMSTYSSNKDICHLPHQTHPLAQLLPNERLEDGEQHIEHVRIVENVHSLQSQAQHVLRPFQQHRRKRRRELHHMRQRQPLKVEDYAAAADLRRRLTHRAKNADLHRAEHVVQRALGGLPFLCANAHGEKFNHIS